MSTQNIYLESAPLHTESAKWAAQAPAQVTAACKRGAHVLAFTEVTPSLNATFESICNDHGYTWICNGRDTALAVKSKFRITDSGVVKVAGRNRAFASFDYNGYPVTVFAMHWATNHASNQDERAEQTQSLIDAMKAVDDGGFVFFMGDSNPTKPLSNPDGEPRATLDKAGVVLIYEQLNDFPNGIGVNMIGSLTNPNISAVKVMLHDALGSDHVPVEGVYHLTYEPRPLVVQAAVDALAEARAHLRGANLPGGPEAPVDAYWQERVNAALVALQAVINDLLLP